MESFLVSTGVVAIAEIGDKTQLLALVLAVRFRTPIPIILGILVATLANHAAAAWFGVWAATLLPRTAVTWAVAASFFAMALWTLKKDSLSEKENPSPRAGAFVTALVAFFVVEIGDKTQIATVTLAAAYEAFAGVIAGTTLGMMIANVPVVLCGEWLARRIPMDAIRYSAAAVFAALGIGVLAAL